MIRSLAFLALTAVVAPLASAELIPLQAGQWQVEAIETRNVAERGRLDSRRPTTSSAMRCLGQYQASLNPDAFLDVYAQRGCTRTTLERTANSFNGAWTCTVDGLPVDISFSATVSDAGDRYITEMVMDGRNDSSSVKAKHITKARLVGACEQG